MLRLISTLMIDSQRKFDEYVNERRDWFQPNPKMPVLSSFTTVVHLDGNWHGEVRFYRSELNRTNDVGRVA